MDGGTKVSTGVNFDSAPVFRLHPWAYHHTVTDFTVEAVIATPAVQLSGSRSVASNAPPGTLVGNVSMVATNGTFTYALESGGDNDNFSIAPGSTNLRTAVWMSAASNNISIVGTETGGGGLVLTNDFVIDVTAADPVFVVAAGVGNPVTDGETVGTALTSSGASVSIVPGLGRDDLFVMAGNDLTVANPGDWVAGTTNYVMLTTSAATGDLIVGVTMGGPSGTVFIFR